MSYTPTNKLDQVNRLKISKKILEDRIAKLEEEVALLKENSIRQTEIAEANAKQNQFNTDIFWKELEQLIEARDHLSKTRPLPRTIPLNLPSKGLSMLK